MDGRGGGGGNENNLHQNNTYVATIEELTFILEFKVRTVEHLAVSLIWGLLTTKRSQSGVCGSDFRGVYNIVHSSKLIMLNGKLDEILSSDTNIGV